MLSCDFLLLLSLLRSGFLELFILLEILFEILRLFGALTPYFLYDVN